MTFRWHMPLDPNCEVVRRNEESQANDPMWAYADIGEEWWEDFSKRHRATCEQCQNYGADNVEVI
jgi:hypothetical protein